MRFLRSALAALTLLASAGAAHAQERITRFHSDVAIKADSTLEVTETIDVAVENVEIRHGIFRDFPTRYRGRHGNVVRAGFTLLGVSRNGVAEPATVSAAGNGVRLRIGDSDAIVPPGEHRYVIRYRTTRQIGRFDGFDELYWNATGTEWRFPIEQASTRIRLPSPAPFGQRAFYTGVAGSRESAARVVEEKPGDITVAATRPLAPGEGLTVAVAFAKDVVAAPSARAGWWLADYGPYLVGGLGLATLCLFYFIAWKRAGRDPRAGTMVPLFAPPDALTPAEMRYIWKTKADDRAFAAALVNTGVKGHIRMVEEEGGFFGKDKMRIDRIAGTAPLSAAEQSMLAQLAPTGGSIVMEQKNHAEFAAARKALDKDYKARFDGVMFHRNWGWLGAGIAIFVASVWLAAAAVDASTGVVDPLHIGLAVACLALAALLAGLMQGMQAVGKCLLAVLAFLAVAVTVALGMPILVSAFETGWWGPLALPLLGLPLMISSIFWMGSPTREGRAVLDRIMGFRHYLSVAEAPRLDRMTPPDETPELFELYLPFAIALGVENKWAKRFEGALTAAAVQGQQGFGWYSGSNSPWSNPTSFTSSVGSSLAGSLGSASSAPGSGGGGSSGGGGGGGGGGGW